MSLHGGNSENINNYCSDLQVLYTPEIMHWLKTNYDHWSIIVTHIGDVEGSDWYGKRFIEIPFAYVEYHWTAKMREAVGKDNKKAQD